MEVIVLDNNKYEGGPFPIDPRLSTEPTGEYERSLPMLEPFERDTHLATLDASHDLGFATVSATAAFGYSNGDATSDQTVGKADGLGAAHAIPGAAAAAASAMKLRRSSPLISDPSSGCGRAARRSSCRRGRRLCR